MAGYSFLKKWIYKPGIEEVNINAYNDIEVIAAGGRSSGGICALSSSPGSPTVSSAERPSAGTDTACNPFSNV